LKAVCTVLKLSKTILRKGSDVPPLRRGKKERRGANDERGAKR
jgi:hypothetical protein